MTPAPTLFPPRFLSEALLTLLALLILQLLSQGLADPLVLDGLNGRYALVGAAPTPANALVAADQRRLRVREKLVHSAAYLAELALTGLLVLALGRARIPPAAFAAQGGASWAGCAALVEPFGIHGRYAAWLALLLAVVTPVVARRWPARPAPQEIASSWHFPGFVLLSGLGLLWLLDYAARAYRVGKQADYPWLGIRHADGLFLAYVVLTLVAGLAPWLLNALARSASTLDSTVQPVEARALGKTAALALLWLAAILAAIWLKSGELTCVPITNSPSC